MGGYNSGRRGRPCTLNDCLVIALPLLMRRGCVRQGRIGDQTLRWSRNGQQIGAIEILSDLTDPRAATLSLFYHYSENGRHARVVTQRLALTTTAPPFGGLRWWMVCPITGRRAAKLYKPPACDRFAGRRAWNLGYESQRVAKENQPFEKLYRLQRKLGSEECWQSSPRRPKGMWRRTFEQHWAEYVRLDHQCNVEGERIEAILTALG